MPTLQPMYHENRPKTVHWGAGALNRAQQLAEDLGLHRVMMVTSPSLVERSTVADRVISALGRGRVVATYGTSREHTPIGTVEEAYELALRHNVDGIVSVGGGSALDTGKGVALACIGGSPDISAFAGSIASVNDARSSPHQLTGKGRVRLIAIPTTLSAAEATRQAGITDRSGIKEQYYHPDIEARGVVLDPALTVDTPRELWLSTGVKALDHAVEVCYSLFTNDYAQAAALGAVRVLSTCLPLTKKEPDDLAHRARLQVAAWMTLHGAVSTHTNAGMNHAIVHRLGGRYGIPHGVATAITLPQVMQFNLSAAEDALALVATVGLGSVADDPEAAAHQAVVGIRELITGLELPAHLSSFAQDDTCLAEVAATVLTDTAMAGNPRQDVTVEQVLGVLRACW